MSFAAVMVMASMVMFTSASKVCSCTMPTSCFTDFYTETTPMYKATALSVLDVPDSEYTWTLFDFHVEFRGCAPTTSKIIVKSPKTESACGVTFIRDTCYLLTVRKAGSSTPPPSVAGYGLDVFAAVSCNYNMPWESVDFAVQTKLYDATVRGC